MTAMLGQCGPDMIYGYKVVVTPDRPRMQLSARVCEFLTPAQIDDHNAWLLRFFGVENILKDGDYMVIDMSQSVLMNPRSYERLKKAAKWHQ